MAHIFMESNVFAHSDEIGCVCPGCCLGEPPQETANGPGGRNGGVSTAALKLAELELLELTGNGRWTPESNELPEREEQQATASPFPYDTDTNDADQGVDGLIRGLVWDQTALTYSFPDSASDYETNYSSKNEPNTFGALNTTQENAAHYSVAQYAAISGLTFEYWGDDAGEDDGDADLRFAESSAPSTAWGYYPSNSYVGGDTWYNPDNYNSPNVGTYAYHTFLHEVGHALGLKHGHETSGPGAVPDAYNSMEYTVMTYYSYIGTTANGYTNASDSYSQSLMMLDIAAIQRMYGANFSENAGNTTYTFSTTTGEMFVDGVSVIASTGLTQSGNKIFRTIWDGNGVDTYDLSNYTTDLAIDLAPGEYVDLDVGGNFQRADLGNWYDPSNPFTYARGHIFNALQYEGDARSLIENANGGSGNDEFFGNAADNVFDGNAGNDTFHGSDGSDTYYGDIGIDSVIYDALFSSFSFSVAGTFLQVIDSAIDWIADTVEAILFSDQTWGFGDLYSFASGNSAPVAVNDGYPVSEDVVLSGYNVLSNDSDPDDDLISVSAVNGVAANVGNQIELASGALLTVNANGWFTYDQNGAFDYLGAGQTGNDSFTYTASDGIAADVATVNITIDGAFDNTPPDAVNDDYTVAEGDALSGDVRLNDSDADGGLITVTKFNGQTANVGIAITLASDALLTLNADGSFSYDQNGAFASLEDGQAGNDSFTYTISDGQGGTDTATASITINGVSLPTMAEPVFIDFETDPMGAYSGAGDLGFAGLSVQNTTALNGSKAGITEANGDFTITSLGGDFDFDGAVFRSVSGRVRITIEAYDDGVLVGTNSFNARSNRDSVRSFSESFDSIDMVVINGAGQFRVDDMDFVVYYEIGPIGNNPPIAMNDAFSTGEGARVEGDVLTDNGFGADSDPDGDALTVTSFAGGTAAGGSATLASGATVTMISDGSFTYDQNNAFAHLYTGESEVDSFTYVISDGSGTDTATVSVTVNGNGAPPPAVVLDFEGGIPTQDNFVFNFDFTATTLTTRAKGVVSGAQAAQSIEDYLSFSNPDSFDFESGYFTATSVNRTTVTVTGFLDGEETGFESFTISKNKESFHKLDGGIFDNVDVVFITANGGVIIDDLTFTF